MLTTLLTVALLHWLVLVTPGANVILVSQLAASGHRRSACYASIGISAVAVTWALFAILGVNGIFALHPQFRLVLQAAGGLYLCYVALKLWRAGAPVVDRQSGQLAPWAAFRLGFITNITNPKSALFFGSVFAAALPSLPGTLLLAAVVILVLVNAVTFHILLALAFSHPRIQTGYARQRKLLNRVASSIVGAYGLRLLVATASEARAR